MYYKVENLGKIKSATIDLSKDLTIFCVPNNTGKTFLSYAIYGLSDPISWGVEIIPSLHSQLMELESKGVVEVNLFDLIFENKEIIYKNNSKSLKSKLPILLGVESNQFENSSLKLFWDDSTLFDEIKKADFQLNFSSMGQFSVDFGKGNNSEFLKISFQRLAFKENDNFNYEYSVGLIHNTILQFLALPIGFPSFFLTAERSGVTVFGKELLSNRFDVTSKLQTLEESKRSDYLKKKTNLYSKAIQDAIQFQNIIPNFKSEAKISQIDFLADQIEEEILRGKISTDDSGDVYYSTNEIRVSIQQAASTIKSMTSLILFLRYRARSGSSLFIDEPELNLHPDNQRLIARIIAQIVNAGIKVFISTHSDYIIRELNNLILLKKFSDTDKTKELMDRYSYEEKELLNPDKVGVYSFEHIEDGKVVVESLPLTDSGININSINKAINNQNVIAQDIYYSLVENEG